jgi:hypothetical protein
MKTALFKFSYLVIAALCFTSFLFTDHLGLNVPVMELITMAGLLLFNKVKFRGIDAYYFVAWTFSAVAVVFVHTSMALWMNFVFFLMSCARLIWPEYKHPMLSLFMMIVNLYLAQHHQWQRFAVYRKMGGRGGRFLKSLPMVAIALVIVVIFIVIYNYASSYFQQSLSWIADGLNNFFSLLVGKVDFFKVQFYVLGFTAISALIIRTRPFRRMVRLGQKSSALERKRRETGRETLSMGLKRERNFGIALLALLNIVILLLNMLDITNIWFGNNVLSTEDGGVLKQFVHEGTYMLILSVIISAIMVLIFFRRNQNFYKNNAWLKRLTWLWLLQNAVLTVSVFIRNYLYIKYFNLAYLRIGVIIFLILVIIGLVLVAYKIWKRQRGFSVFAKGIHISLFVLLICSFINWDRAIVNYNIQHKDCAYFHHDFMVTLPDNTLGILKANESLFNVPDTIDNSNHYTEEFFGYTQYDRTYSDWLHIRYTSFINDWDSRDWRTWNYPEAEAYKSLQ